MTWPVQKPRHDTSNGIDAADDQNQRNQARWWVEKGREGHMAIESRRTASMEWAYQVKVTVSYRVGPGMSYVVHEPFEHVLFWATAPLGRPD